MSARTHTFQAVPSLTPTSNTVRPTAAQQGLTHTPMAQKPGKFWAANSHNPALSWALCTHASRVRSILHTPPRARQLKADENGIGIAIPVGASALPS
jgi:hypothetical protein